MTGPQSLVLFCVFFSPFSIAITSVGEKRANLSVVVHLFDLRLFCFCLFPLPLGVLVGLWFVIVAPLDFSLSLFSTEP